MVFQGGDRRHHVDLDHPLYITDNREGGYDIKTEYDREQEKLFAGVESEFGMVSISCFNSIPYVLFYN